MKQSCDRDTLFSNYLDFNLVSKHTLKLSNLVKASRIWLYIIGLDNVPELIVERL